jgi:CubicO group peptidase (beta-lactamase class C family)
VSDWQGSDWDGRLAALAAEHRVPGAVLGIARGDEQQIMAYGVTNVDTAVEVTAGTLFQIGSITKVFTATVVMRLVEQGVLDLDKPVVGYLPELTLSEPELTGGLTLRHLLTHTSGIDGDVFTDTGRDDDALQRYVTALARVPVNHPLGRTLSYCNAGYSLAGRVVEKVTGQVWDTALRDLLTGPLGLGRTVTLPDEAILHRTAVGHIHEGDEPPRRTPVWGIARASGPAGTINADMADLLAFARLHLRDGVATDGTRLLSAQTARSMRAREVEIPDPYTIADSWGLGWFRQGAGGATLIGHDGNTIGQSAFLRMMPDHDLVVGLLTNGGHTRDLYESLVRQVVRELAGVELAAPVVPPQPPPEVDLAPYEGTYERTGVRLEVRDGGQGPRVRVVATGPVEGVDRPPKEFDLVPVREAVYAYRQPGHRTWTSVVFLDIDGRPYVHTGLRATPRVAS